MLKQAILAVALSGAMLAGPCMAHAKLQNSSPAKDAQLTEPPKTLTLTFNEAAQVAVLKLIGGGKEIPIAVDKNAKASASFTFPLPVLAPGSYTVQWTAVAADDGHVTKGTFAFAIKA
ncbi:MAG: copper resistance protein CopC [Pseudomonadota bacterium]|nr:copper resistance protein CopC [Pseudomonadota bacterium]